MLSSITPAHSSTFHYLPRLADTCLILSQRLAEWCGRVPVLEEDIALANMALDLVGQARVLLTQAGQLESTTQGTTPRDELDYFNVTPVELPRGDFAFTVLRNAIVATWFEALWTWLVSSSDVELAAIAGKAVKEACYHRRHAIEDELCSL